MKILFLGGVFPKDQEAEIFHHSKGIIQTAANNLQWNIIEGIESATQKNVDIISSVFIGDYPKLYQKWVYRHHHFSHVEGAKDFAIGFLNFKGLEIYHRMFKLFSPVKQWIKKNRVDQEPITIFVYSAQAQFLNTIKKIKDYAPEVQVCLIVPDLPEYFTVTNHRTFARYFYDKFMKEKLLEIIYSNMKFVDSFVVLTDYMKEPLKIDQRPYVVVEGIVSQTKLDVNSSETKHGEASQRFVLYTGTLAIKYGIMDLVTEFRRIKDHTIQLVICGDGDARETIEEIALEDQRIQYKGVLKHKDIIQLQKKATLVVNPRKNNEAYTKYSFPSKTMEYMQSGRPVLMYRLDGIPETYDPYLYYFDQWPQKEMHEVIQDLCNKTPQELTAFGEKARSFVLQNKNAQVQGKRIIEMIEQNSNHG